MATEWFLMNNLPPAKTLAFSETVDILSIEGIMSGFYDYGDGVWRRIDNTPIFDTKFMRWAYQQ